jgi:hypothetical protein
MVSGFLGLMLNAFANRMFIIVDLNKKRKGFPWKGMSREKTRSGWNQNSDLYIKTQL